MNRSANVWEAIGETDNFRIRSQVMRALNREISAWNLPQKDAAARLLLTQPRLSELVNGKIDKFSLDALVNLLPLAGLEMEVTVRERAR